MPGPGKKRSWAIWNFRKKPRQTRDTISITIISTVIIFQCMKVLKRPGTLLEDMGNPMPNEVSPEKVESVCLGRYVSADEADLYQEKIFQDQEEIEKILEQITFTEGRFTVGSPVNYDVNTEIRWKDQEKDPVFLYLMENDSLSGILDQLYQQNPD